MKQVCAAILMILFLNGCAAAQPEKTEETIHIQPPGVEAELLSSSGKPLPAQDTGSVEKKPLYLPDCYGLYPMGEDLLVISSADSQMLLTKVSGNTLTTSTARSFFTGITGSPPGLRVCPDKVYFFDAQTSRVIILNTALDETASLDVPEDLTGTPLLSGDGKSIYYCTEAGIRCLNTQTGISRRLKEFPFPKKTLCSLLLDDTVLQCRYLDDGKRERFLFLSTETGRTLHDSDRSAAIVSSPQRYYAAFKSGWTDALVFGIPGDPPQALLPRDLSASCAFLPESNGAVTWKWSENYQQIFLEHYDLSSGLLTGKTSIPANYPPRFFCSDEQGTVYFMLYSDHCGCDCLCRWNPSSGELLIGAQHTALYRSAENPDPERISECEKRALDIGERFGIRIHIWKDALQVQPSDYALEAEYRTELIDQALLQLETRLSRFPDAVFQRLGGFHICLVRSLRTVPGSSGAENTSGIQFWQGNDAYIVLAIGPDSEMALYHELFHLMETQIFSESNALDDWDNLNPGEFVYDYDYATNRSRSDYQYLQETSRSFIDIYSMSYPKEDRARIMEYAMTENHSFLFDAPMLQYKLVALCRGIREAFHLTSHPEALPWEQYLWRPLTPENTQ